MENYKSQYSTAFQRMSRVKYEGTKGYLEGCENVDKMCGFLRIFWLNDRLTIGYTTEL